MEVLQFEKLEEFVRIPKVELHAHLNGSFSHDTLKKLINIKKMREPNLHMNFSELDCSSKNLSECFRMFSLIHNLIDSYEAIYMATCDVIKEFSNDGVCYLELRTTPKGIKNSMSQEMYIETILKAIKETEKDLNEKIVVKLLLSMDRKRDISHAEETLKIAERFFTSSQTVIGIDFSGDPTVGQMCSFIPLLECAKKKGLKLSIHSSEVPGADDEVEQVLKLQPDRLGHGSFLHPVKGGSEKNFTLLKELKIPLEICLTSNVICKTTPSYEEHHFKLFREMNYPCILCTDDKGIFNTSLSKEYYLASRYYQLTNEDLCMLSFNGINYAFCSESEKAPLREICGIPKYF